MWLSVITYSSLPHHNGNEDKGIDNLIYRVRANVAGKYLPLVPVARDQGLA